MQYDVLEQVVKVDEKSYPHGKIATVRIARCANLAAAQLVAEAIYEKRFGFYFLQKAKEEIPPLEPEPLEPKPDKTPS